MAMLLAAAGILKGLEATTHWMLLDRLPAYGARPTLRRVVEQGKVITAAGVSSGIDIEQPERERALGARCPGAQRGGRQRGLGGFLPRGARLLRAPGLHAAPELYSPLSC